MHPTPQAAASTLQPPDRAPADSLPACAEPGHLGHEPKSSLIPPALASSLAAALLVACGGGGSDSAPGTGTGGTGAGPGGGTGTGTTATPASDEEAARFLLQAQFSATDEEIAALRAKGYGPWLAEQFALPVDTTGTAWLMQRGYGVAEAGTRYDNVSYPSDFMLWSQLFTERDAVRKRVALALSEIMVVSTTGLEQPWSIFLASGYWDLLDRKSVV